MNGKAVKLKGVCLQHGAGCLGAVPGEVRVTARAEGLVETRIEVEAGARQVAR